MKIQFALPEATHLAFCDESHHNVGRYRSAAVVSVAASPCDALSQTIRDRLDESGISELKFQGLRQARDRIAARKIVDFVIQQAVDHCLRVDLVVWDIEDSRNKVMGRDDNANLGRMYYQLLRNVFSRWPGPSVWAVYPDENPGVDFYTLHSFLGIAGRSRGTGNKGLDLFGNGLRREFLIAEVEQVDSRVTPLCQVADLFAGLAVFSWDKYDRFCRWRSLQGGQIELFAEDNAVGALSGSERERFAILDYFDQECKKRCLGVSLNTRQGLWTPDPSNPINFWFYVPQRPEDKAPVRVRSGV